MKTRLSKDSAGLQKDNEVGRVIPNAPRRLKDKPPYPINWGCVPLVAALLAIGLPLHAQSTGIYVNSSNNVGIGTTSPQSKLHISGGATDKLLLDNGVILSQKNVSGVIVNLLTHYNNDEVYLDNPSGGIHVRTTEDDLDIKRGGNVGIGTASPGGKLTVAETNSLGNVFVQIGGQGGAPAGQRALSIGYGDVYNGVSMGESGYIQAELQGSGYKPLLLDPLGGNVGIGTTNPVFPLDINGSGERITGGNGNATQLDLVQTNGGHDWDLVSWGSAAGGGGGALLNKFSIYDNTLGLHRLVIDGNGNVGIGTQSPGATLDVNGTVRAVSYIATTSGTKYADFVFKPGYKLAPLREVEASIKKEGHLPGIPDEAEARAHGIDLASMQVKLLQKIEELTLHQIEQEKLLEEQNRRIGQLEKENTELRAGITTDARGL